MHLLRLFGASGLCFILDAAIAAPGYKDNPFYCPVILAIWMMDRNKKYFSRQRILLAEWANFNFNNLWEQKHVR